jgi:hypothetical protein
MTEEPTDELGRTAADHERILEVLVAHEVEFLVAGGLAVIAHGHQRFTRDLDLIPSPRESNLRRLAGALSELGAAAVGARGERLRLDLSHPGSLAVGNYFLSTNRGALDLLNGPRPELKRYLRLDAAAIEVEIGAHAIKIVSKADLIAMKREAGRPQDLRDIAALTEVERNP